MDNHIPVLVFALKDPQNIIRALCGEKIGTIVKEALNVHVEGTRYKVLRG